MTMKAFNISLLIILLCISVEMTNSIITGIGTHDGSNIHLSGAPYDSNSFNTNASPQDYTKIPGGDVLGSVFIIWEYLNMFVNFIVFVLYSATIGFGQFLQDFFYVPAFIATPIMIIVNIIHILGIAQFVIGRPLSGAD